MIDLLHNVRLAIRNLRRTPSFTATVVLTLAVGIGLSTAVFTVAEGIILRRLPVADQDRIVILSGRTPDASIQNYPLGLKDGEEFARTTRTLSAAGLVTYEGASPRAMRLDDQLVRLRRALVSGSYFQTMGVKPVIGRLLEVHDDVAGAQPVLVLSYRTWRERFRGERSVVGRRISSHEDDRAYTVVGVAAQGFEFPKGSDMWATIQPSIGEAALPYMAANVVGRLSTGATPEQARDEMTAFFRRPDASSAYRPLSGAVVPLADAIIGETRGAVWIFAAAAALLLLITCVNVGNLLFVRGLGRVREIAVRTALGASRGALARMMLRENILLALAGCAAGLLVGAAVVRGFIAFAPPGLPRKTEIHLDANALLASAAISVLALLAFGILPAWFTSGVASQEALRSGSRQSPSRRSRGMTELAVSAQIALATLVLAAAALLGRSFMKLRGADLAFEPSPISIAEIVINSRAYPDAPSQIRLVNQLTAAIQNIPGVEAVSPVVAVPFSGAAGWDGKLTADGQSADEALANPMLNMELVATSYFRTFNVTALRGRVLTDDDREGSAPVVVLSESAARHYWGNASPIGKRIFLGQGGGRREFVVVGIVADTRYRELRNARASVYFPLKQSFFPFAPTTLAIRSPLPVASVTQSVRRALAENTSGVELAGVRPFTDFLVEPLAQPRLNAALLALFGAASVGLAAIGLFGVLATMVRQRRGEFGVRLALGARASDVRRLVIGRAMLLSAAGIVAGVATSLMTNRALSSLMYNVGTSDAWSLAAVVLVLATCAIVASVIPAMWTGRIQPLTALRSD